MMVLDAGGYPWWLAWLMVATYASTTCEQPAGLGNEPLHVGEALLPKVERNVNNVRHKAKCCKCWVISLKVRYHITSQNKWKRTLQRGVEEKCEEAALVTLLLERCWDVLQHRCIGYSTSLIFHEPDPFLPHLWWHKDNKWHVKVVGEGGEG